MNVCNLGVLGLVEVHERSANVDMAEGLFDRADTSRDGALTNVELLKLTATTPPARLVTAGGRIGGGGYTFGDQVGFSTRSHIDGALDDLMLPSATRERARWRMP